MSPPPALPSRRLRRSSVLAEARAGFSLVELMVGLSLGMLTLLAMSQVYVAFVSASFSAPSAKPARSGTWRPLMEVDTYARESE